MVTKLSKGFAKNSFEISGGCKRDLHMPKPYKNPFIYIRIDRTKPKLNRS